ncbi:Tn3 family transposase [Streptosporangium roseum]|uniref:Tn3 family transposase n=1 Tax=Streptosporangium roseum TaxID=2001 RepID=UPI00331EF010
MESASHPTHQAMLEVGRAQKTIFVARYLRPRELPREIQEGLNVVGSSNGANSVIFYGKGGDIATNRREELEMSVLCLRILHAALVSEAVQGCGGIEAACAGRVKAVMKPF